MTMITIHQAVKREEPKETIEFIQFDNLDEVIYLENHLSKTSTKYQGEMTHLLLQHREYPGSNNGTGLFQVLTGLKMRATYERLTTKEAKIAAKV